MKKFTLLLFVCILQYVFAQDYKITYNLEYKRDSTADKTNKIEMVLLIENGEAKFLPEKLLTMDQVMEPGTKMFRSLGSGFTVQSKLGSSEFTTYEVFQSNYYAIHSNDTMQWKIEAETKEENGYQLQRATTTFGKRNWEAWFIPEIPLSEGPYKFHGLPGLIYEIHDSKDNYTFRMTSIKKLDTPVNTSNVLEQHFGTKPIVVSEKQFQKLVLDDYNNPFANYRAIGEGHWAIGKSDGSSIKTIKELDEYSKEYRAEKRKNNNPIELNHAIKFPPRD